MPIDYNLLGTVFQERLDPFDHSRVDTILRHFLEEEGMVNFIECFSVVQVNAVGVFAFKKIFQDVIKMMKKLCKAAVS